jgi:hypothetical protein
VILRTCCVWLEKELAHAIVPMFGQGDIDIIIHLLPLLPTVWTVSASICSAQPINLPSTTAPQFILPNASTT